MSQEQESSVMRFGAALDSNVPILRRVALAMSATMRLFTAIMMKRDRLIASLSGFSPDALLCPVTVAPFGYVRSAQRGLRSSSRLIAALHTDW